MSDWMIAQAFACSLLVAEGLVLAWWYRRSVVRPARLEAAQYKFFSLRDKAIRLAIDDPSLESDNLWRGVYQLLNEASKERNVDRMMKTSVPQLIGVLQSNGLPVRVDMSGKAPVGATPIDPDSLPPVLSLAIRGAITVLETCYRMTWLLRVKYWLAGHIGAFRRALARETSRYAAWQQLLTAVAGLTTRPRVPDDSFEVVLDQEAARQKRQLCGA